MPALPSGDMSALAEALAERPELDEDQFSLNLFSPPETAAGEARTFLRPRGPGRPPGAKNRRHERTLERLRRDHRDPREVLLEIAEAQVDDLAALYGCTNFEAAQEKRLAATAVLPFLASRQPIELDLTQKSVVYLTINDGLAEPAGEDAGIGMVATVLNRSEYTEVEEP